MSYTFAQTNALDTRCLCAPLGAALAPLCNGNLPADRLALAPAPLPKAIQHVMRCLVAGDRLQAAKPLDLIFTLLNATPGLSDLSAGLEASLAFYDGRLDEALAKADQAIAVCPSCAAYHALRARIALARQDSTAALLSFQNAHACAPSDTEAALALSLKALLQERYEDMLPLARLARQSAAQPVADLADVCLFMACLKLDLPQESTIKVPTGEQEEDLAVLPPLLGAFPVSIKTAQDIFFTAGLFKDFDESFLPLLGALAAREKKPAVHLHFFNPDARTPRAIEETAKKTGLNLSWSGEDLDPFVYGDVPTYLASVPFCRFFQFLKATGRDAFYLSPTLLPAADLTPPENGGALALCLTPRALFWDRFQRAPFFARAVPQTLQVLHFVSRFIAENLMQKKKGTWLPGLAFAIAAAQDPGAFSDISWKENALDRAALRTQSMPQEDPLRTNARKPVILAESLLGPIFVNENDVFIGPTILKTGLWAEDELELLRPYVKNGDTVIDVGANVGMHTLAFARWVGPQGVVHAFEPQRAIFNMLAETMTLNNLAHVSCHLAAVGAKTGSIHVPAVNYDQLNNFGGLSLNPNVVQAASIVWDRARGEEIPLMRLDDLALPSCRLIKVDVEGMEASVLAGAQDLIARTRPVLYLEFHTNQEAILAILDKLGYATKIHMSDNENLLAWPKG